MTRVLVLVFRTVRVAAVKKVNVFIIVGADYLCSVKKTRM